MPEHTRVTISDVAGIGPIDANLVVSEGQWWPRSNRIDNLLKLVSEIDREFPTGDVARKALLKWSLDLDYLHGQNLARLTFRPAARAGYEAYEAFPYFQEVYREILLQGVPLRASVGSSGAVTANTLSGKWVCTSIG